MKNILFILSIFLSILTIQSSMFSQDNTSMITEVLRIDEKGNKFLTTDGGLTWSFQLMPFNNNQTILLLQNDERFVSTNSGTSWINIESENSDLMMDNLLLYPNPAQNNLNIRLDNMEKGAYELVIFNFKGEKTIESSMNITEIGKSISLDISSLSVGSYLIKVNKGLSQYYTGFFIKF